MTLAIDSNKPIIPTEDEIKLSQESSRLLAPLIRDRTSTIQVKIVKDDGDEQNVVIPATTFHLLVDILSQMAQGNAVSIVPIHSELTTQEAADLLNVSRPFLIKLIESQEIPCRKVGRHRRIRFAHLMEYKQKTDNQRNQALDELAAQAQELNMGYE
ncbi:MAG: helix-turn-helix domain-containing protein [Pleurocapsa sp. MO_226.B13]|nr:helix-turn-helix domain-containing protein [Pleurocapsa sp. MO_226.B13]